MNNLNHLKGWTKIPIPKQIEDEKHNRKQTKHNESYQIRNVILKNVRYLKNGKRQGNKTKIGNCTNVHSEHTANWPYIKGQGRDRVEGSSGRGQ